MTLREQFAEELSKRKTLNDISIYLREFMDDGMEDYADLFLSRAFRMGLELNVNDGASLQKELMIDIVKYCIEYIKGNNISDISEIERILTDSLKSTSTIKL